MLLRVDKPMGIPTAFARLPRARIGRKYLAIRRATAFTTRVHQQQSGTLGGTFIKVRAWRHGMQFESDTIRFVNGISSVRTPEVLYAWVDVDWDRSFLVLKAMEGQTLDQA